MLSNLIIMALGVYLGAGITIAIVVLIMSELDHDNSTTEKWKERAIALGATVAWPIYIVKFFRSIRGGA